MNNIAELKDISTEINTAHNKVVEACRASVGHAMKAGELLIQAKSMVAHGEWQNWLEDNCTVSERTAQVYMKLSRDFPKLDESKAQHVADLPLRDAMNAVSSATTALGKAKKMGIDLEKFAAGEEFSGGIRRKVTQEIRKINCNSHLENKPIAFINIDGQALSLEKNDDLSLFKLRKGANEAYLKLQERINYYKKDELYIEDKLEAEELIKEAGKLEAKAKRLRKESEKIMSYANEDIRVRLSDVYAKPEPSETLTIKPNSNDQYLAIKKKDQKQAISSLLGLLKDGDIEIIYRSIKADITLMPYLDVSPTYPVNGWHGIGIEA